VCVRERERDRDAIVDTDRTEVLRPVSRSTEAMATGGAPATRDALTATRTRSTVSITHLYTTAGTKWSPHVGKDARC
jgi:hypothetical protein